MKTNRVVILILILLFNILQLNAVNKRKITQFKAIDELNLQGIVEINQSKEDIFNKIKDYIKTNYNASPESKITDEDFEKGEIKGIGSMVLYVKMDYYDYIVTIGSTNVYIFNYIYEIKDNKFRITMNNFYYINNKDKKKFQNGKKRLREINRAIKKNKFLENLSDYIEGIEKKTF